MEGEDVLVSEGDAAVTLTRSREGSALLVVNDHGRVRVPLSHEQAEGLAKAAPGGKAEREIERKMLVEHPPEDLEAHPNARLRQGYIVVGADAVFRIREKGGGAKVTVKRGAGLDRAEVEIEVSDVQADLLWPLAGARLIDKTRYNIPDGGGTLELDVYHGRHAGLMVVEREFETPSAAEAWTPPSWVGREVTEDTRYTNARLALEGLPEAL